MADYTNFLASLGFGNPQNGVVDPNAFNQVNGIGQPMPQAPAPPQLPVQNSVVPGILAQMQQQNGDAPAPVDPSAAQPPVNAMQAADPTQAPAVPQPVPDQAPVAAAAPASVVAPKKRLSLLDAIGRTADVLANVGGAKPLYQSSLDDRAAKQLAAEDHARAVVSNTLANAHTQQEIDASKATTGKTEAETQTSLQALAASRYGAALRGLQAIQKSNPNVDVSTVFPILAKQAGIDDAGAQHLLGVIQQNPGAVDGLAAEYEKQKAGAGGGELGLNPFLATDGHGNTKAYQLSKTGDLHEITLPPGFQAATTTSIVDTGDHQIVTDKRTGKVIQTFVKSGAPEKDEHPILDAKGNIVAYSPVAGSKLDKAEQKAGAGTADPFTSYAKARKGLQNLVNSIDDLSNDHGLGHATGVMGMATTHLPAGMGGADTQRILGKIETLKGKAIPSALNTMRDVSGKLGFRPSQVEVLGDAKGLLGAVDNRKQSTADYIASLQANKQLILKQIQDMDADAQRNGYVVNNNGKLVPAPKKPASAPTPAALPPRVTLTPKPKAGGQPTVSNW